VPTLRTVLDREPDALRRAVLCFGMAEWLDAQADQNPGDATFVRNRRQAAAALSENAADIIGEAVVAEVGVRFGLSAEELAHAGWELRVRQRELMERLGGRLGWAEEQPVPSALLNADVTAADRNVFDTTVAAEHRQLTGPADMALTAARANVRLGGRLRASARRAVQAERAEQAAAEALVRRDRAQGHRAQVTARVMEARAIEAALQRKAELSAGSPDEPGELSPRGRLLEDARIMAAYADLEVERFRVREGKARAADLLGGQHTDPGRRAEAQGSADELYRDEEEALTDTDAQRTHLLAARIRLQFNGIARPQTDTVRRLQAAADADLGTIAAADARRQVAFARETEPPQDNAAQSTSATKRFWDAVRRFAKEPEVAALYAKHAGPPEPGRNSGTAYRFDGGTWVATNAVPRTHGATAAGLGGVTETAAASQRAEHHDQAPRTDPVTGPSAHRTQGREPPSLRCELGDH
jgi:hypothetical protein